MAVCIPFLGVPDIVKTVAWYEAIGFTCSGSNRYWNPEEELSWAQLEWEGAAFMLFYSPKIYDTPVRDAGLYFKVAQLNGIADRLRNCAKIIELNEIPFHARTEIVFEDLNGFRITIAASQ